MAYRNLTPDELKNFQAGRPANAPPPDPNAPVATPLSDPSLGSDIMSSVGGGIEGFGKQLLGGERRDMGVPPLFPGVGKAISAWSKSDDPKHPTAEKVGRGAEDVAEYLPLFAAPEGGTLDLLKAGASGIGKLGPILRHPKVAKAISDVIESGWQGAGGGAAENPKEPEKGAETGATLAEGSTIGRMAGQTIADFAPARVKKAAELGGKALGGLTAGAGMMGAEHMLGNRSGGLPYHYLGWHVAPTLMALAAALFGGRPAAIGGIGEKAAQQAGFDRPPMPGSTP